MSGLIIVDDTPSEPSTDRLENAVEDAIEEAVEELSEVVEEAIEQLTEVIADSQPVIVVEEPASSDLEERIDALEVTQDALIEIALSEPEPVVEVEVEPVVEPDVPPTTWKTKFHSWWGIHK